MIDILLATYNGEKYLHTQINSLLAQTKKDWRLLVHDDGSNDRTVQIIKDFQTLDDRIVLIEDGIVCGGAGANFLHLFKYHATADFVAFCDQDDYWLENKLQTMWQALSIETNSAAVFASGMLFSDTHGIMGGIPSLKPKELKELFFLSGGLQGCSLMLNKSLTDTLRLYEGYMVMHDYLLTAGALCFGRVIYLDKNLMLYRQQHEGKVTANADNRLMTRLKNNFPVIDEKHHQSLVGFFKFYDARIEKRQRKLFEEYLKLYNADNLLEKIQILLKNKFQFDKSTIMLVLKLILRPTKG